MELIVIIVAFIALDILAMRFGADSRHVDTRDLRGWWPASLNGDPMHDSIRSRQSELHYEANLGRLASVAAIRRPPTRLRVAHSLRVMAARLEPATYEPARPARTAA
jgi:hypothetical protein